MTAFIDRFRRICDSRILPVLISVNCIIFIVLWLTVRIGNYGGNAGNFTMQWLCVSSSVQIAVSHPWTILTYMFVHYDFLHLLFNMLWLFWFGRLLMTTLTDRHLLWLYIGGGITGAVFYIVLQVLAPGMSVSGAYLCGASASVLAIMTAAALRTPDMRLYLFLFGEVKMKWVALGCIILTFVGVGGGNTGGQAAHVGGVVYGLLSILALKKGYDITRLSKTPKSKHNYKTDGPVRTGVVRDGNAVANAVSGKLSDTARLDELLDKIRLSGYSSLTESEKKELNALSQRLHKK